MKKAFSLIESLLAMLIVGVIAAVSVTAFRPDKYKEQAMLALRQKAYASFDEATRAVMIQCTKNMNLKQIYNNCDKSSGTHSFGVNDNAIYARFMQGTTGAVNAANGNCNAGSQGASTLRLKNGICYYFYNASDAATNFGNIDDSGNQAEVHVDVNSAKGPNSWDGKLTDKMLIIIDARKGVTSDLPQ